MKRDTLIEISKLVTNVVVARRGCRLREFDAENLNEAIALIQHLIEMEDNRYERGRLSVDLASKQEVQVTCRGSAKLAVRVLDGHDIIITAEEV